MATLPANHPVNLFAAALAMPDGPARRALLALVAEKFDDDTVEAIARLCADTPAFVARVRRAADVIADRDERAAMVQDYNEGPAGAYLAD